MLIKVLNESPFQVLTGAFTIGPSETGYELQVGATPQDFATLFSVGANTTRMVTNVANGSYYRLKNNVGEVKVNWSRTCVTNGGGSGSGTELAPVEEFPLGAEAGTVVAYNGTASASGVYQYTGEEWVPVGVDDLSAYWTSAQTKDYVDSASTVLQEQIDTMDDVVSAALVDLNERIDEMSGSSVDLSGYYTKAETDSAITAVEDHIYDVEKVAASALTELHNDILELSGSSVDLSGYYTSGETDAAISAATAGKANAANVAERRKNWIPGWNSQGIITGGTQIYEGNITVNGLSKTFYQYQSATLPPFYAPLSAGTAGDILVSTGNGAPVWSAMPAADVTKAYVDSADTALQDQIDTMDDVVSAALVDLNTRKVESTSVSTIWKGTQAEYDAIVTKDTSTLYIIVNNS